jgi:hypothetical protein
LTDAQWDEIEKRASYGCTHDEIADYLGISKRTFYAPHLRERFERVTKTAIAQRRYELRKARVDAAIDKPLSVTGIWVDKNILGWTDRQAITGKDGGPLEFASAATDHLTEVLDRLAEKLKK